MLWPWLAREPLVRVAATVGARLGPDWSGPALVEWVTSRRRPLLADPDAPLAYLAALLDDACASDTAPPYPAAAHTTYRRALVAAHGAAHRERQAQSRAAIAARDRTAVRPGRRSAAVEAALAAIRARTSGRLRRAELLDTLDTTAAIDAEDWPEVAQPGGGLPTC